VDGAGGATAAGSGARPAYNLGGEQDHGRDAAAEPVIGRLELRLVGPGLLGFWALYFAIVALSNLADLLRGLHVLPAGWSWVSGNLAFIGASTGKFGLPAWLNPILLAGVVAWQILAAVLLCRAAREPDGGWLGPAFVVSLGHWAVFILLDEVLLIFETGVEATHLRLLMAQLLTLVLVRPGGALSRAARS
jgi:hypothetical protein